MALTPLRWIAAMLAGCFLLVAYFYSPDEREQPPDDRREVLASRERQLGWAANQAADRLRAIVIIDSVRRETPRTAAGDTLRILVDRGIPVAARAALRAAALRALAELGNPRLPVDLAFVLDTVDKVRGVPRGAGRSTTGEYVLPATDTDRCLSIVRIRSTMTRDEAERRLTEIASRLADRRLLGPCAFVGRFGRPGPHVAEWLSRSAWGYTLVAGWSRHSPRWSAPAWYGLGESNEDGWPLRYYMGLEGYRCASGDRGACGAAISAPAPTQRRSALPQTWGNRVISSAQSENEWYYRLNLGPRQANFLSDLVTDVGTDNFRRFWTSREPVEQAFESATGRSLSAATYDWMQSQYAGFVGRGAAVPPLTAGLTLLFIGGGAATAMLAARRRSVR